MALRSQKTIGACVALVICGLCAAAAPATIAVRHTHLRKGGVGELRIGESSISFHEIGKKQMHSREWPYVEIQQLTVAQDYIRIVTYEDVRWKLGSDREYAFDQLPEGTAQRVLDAVRGRIDERRLVVAIPHLPANATWQVKAKLLEGRSGTNGTVLASDGAIVYKSEKPDASRTWQFRQIENVSRSGPFDLTITTFERDGSRFEGRRDYRFQLKEELTEERYNALWRQLNESHLTQLKQGETQ